MALSGKDKQVIDLSLELGKKLKDQEFKQAWTLAGELSALLKNTDDLSLPYQVIECIKKDVASYYSMNQEYNKVTNRAFAIGSSFERSASI